MDNIKIPIHRISVKSGRKAIDKWNVSEQDKKDVKKFLDDLGLGKVNKGRKISEGRQLRYIDFLKTSLEFFEKPVKELTVKDIERFEKALTSDKLRCRIKKTPYASETKSTLKKALRIYLRWKRPEDAHKLVDWLDYRKQRKTPDFLSEPDVEKLYRACNTAELRFIVAVLFDAGARAEEFHNIRFEDIFLPEGKNNFIKISLKEEYSKTKGRTIGLYWKYSTNAVLDYLDERKKEGIASKDPVFKNSYDNTRCKLQRLGKKVLGRSIHYHLFRHSSATYYAPKMNRQELCYRYGWTFSSDMPDVYISRSGEFERQVNEKFTNTELEELKRQLMDHEQKNKFLADEQNKLKEEIKQIRDMNKNVLAKLESLK